MALWRCVSVLFALWLSIGTVYACAICAPVDTQNTVVARVAATDVLGIAQMLAGGTHVQALRAVRGSLPSQPFAVDGLQVPAAGPLPAVLVTFDVTVRSWRALGYLPESRFQWVSDLAALAPANTLSPEQAMQRAADFARDLEDPVFLVAQAAYEEIAALPYGAMPGAARVLQTTALLRWLADTQNEARHPLYYLLLGLRGEASFADAISAKAMQRKVSDPLPLLSAQLTAVLALRGPAALPWLEAHFLRGAAVSDAALQAALMAVRVQSGAGGRLTPQDFVQLCERFIAANPQRAGLVASDLAALGRWEFAPVFAQLLRTEREMDFASRFPIVVYLMRNPTNEAQLLVRELRADGLL